VTTYQQEKSQQTEDRVPSMEEAERKAQDNEPKEEEPEVQVVLTQETTEPSSSAGIPETPMTQW